MNTEKTIYTFIPDMISMGITEFFMHIGIFIVLLYFLPFIIASTRNVKNSISIFVFNLFFGWTLIFWIILLAWASSDCKRKEEGQSSVGDTFCNVLILFLCYLAF
jgi:hypothetical protein